MVEAALFGHIRAFTDAIADRRPAVEGGRRRPVPRRLATCRSNCNRSADLCGSVVSAIGDPRPRRADVRVVAATRDLEQMVADREFRQDLYYRLNVVRSGPAPQRTSGRYPRVCSIYPGTNREAANGRELMTDDAEAEIRRRPWSANNVLRARKNSNGPRLFENGRITAADLDRPQNPPSPSHHRFSCRPHSRRTRTPPSLNLKETGGNKSRPHMLGIDERAFQQDARCFSGSLGRSAACLCSPDRCAPNEEKKAAGRRTPSDAG